ncbi:cytochrome c oxidase assembly protein [Edaphobacter sp. HDX4]|uniref:cytochrome c oxidase assembly protein n=1 Tax=Edaphobacter sp. HDX4 TaxID=2794064 RepID=UPI002FE62AB3
MKGHGDAPSMLLPMVLVCIAATGYVLLAVAQRRRPCKWSRVRTGLFLSGCVLLIWGLSPGALPFAPGDFRKHMLQHLLIGMFAPIGLVMAAPVTLLLRTLPSRWGRRVTGILRSRAMHWMANPLVALALDLGGMALLDFSPLYRAMMMNPSLDYLIHFHFVAAGCLYTWVIAGPDPAPHRPTVPMRLMVLGVAVVIHSVLSQLLYAGWHVSAAAPLSEVQRGAELMYYGGDIAELLLAFALVTSWHPAKKHVEFAAA